MTFRPPRNNNRSFPRRSFNPDKEFRFIHTPFKVTHIEDENTKLEYECDKDGKVTIIQTDKKTTEYDQVTVPASMIFALATMLETTRKVKYQDRKKDDTTGRTTEG